MLFLYRDMILLDNTPQVSDGKDDDDDEVLEVPKRTTQKKEQALDILTIFTPPFTRTFETFDRKENAIKSVKERGRLCKICK